MVSAEEKKKRQRKANIAAALTCTFVALFAIAYIGVITMLNDYADQLQAENSPDIEVAEYASTEPFFVLLIGSDSLRGTAVYTNKSGDVPQADQYADVITLMRVDPRTYKITLVTVPRDTVVNGETEKINAHLNSNDPQEVVDAVEKLTGVNIDYYMMTTFISFENLINALGGITVDVPKTVSVVDPATGKKVNVKAGEAQQLNGAQALVLARARKDYKGNQDALRQVNVRNIERAIIQKVVDMGANIDVEHVLAALDNDTKTNLDLPSVGLLMLKFMEHADEMVIYDGTGNYDGGERPGDGAWVVNGDEQAWEDLMTAVNAGEDPSTIIKPPSFEEK